MNKKQLEMLGDELNITFEDEDQFRRELAEYMENEYRYAMRQRGAYEVIPNDAHAYFVQDANETAAGEYTPDCTCWEVEKAIQDAVSTDCDDAEKIVRGDELEALYNHFRDDGEEGFREWCKAELGEDEPNPNAYYCMRRRNNISKQIDLNAVALGDRRVWLHPLYTA